MPAKTDKPNILFIMWEAIGRFNITCSNNGLTGYRTPDVSRTDDGDVLALRVGPWKIHFMERRAEGLEAWREPFSRMRILKFFNLRSDRFEEAQVSVKSDDWFLERNFLLYATGLVIAQWPEGFKEFPARARSASFGIDDVVVATMPKG
jgi:hypothetical protein